MSLLMYVAGPFADRDKVRVIADKLREAGHRVSSSWLEINELPPEGTSREEYYREQGLKDLHEVITSDMLIYCNTGTISEGKATELGVAIATLKPTIIIGDRSNNIFLHLNIPCFPDVDAAIRWMVEQKAAYMASKGITEIVEQAVENHDADNTDTGTNS